MNRKVKDELIAALKKTITEFYGNNIQESPDFGRIVNHKHFSRLDNLLRFIMLRLSLVVDQMKMKGTLLYTVRWDYF